MRFCFDFFFVAVTLAFALVVSPFAAALPGAFFARALPFGAGFVVPPVLRGAALASGLVAAVFFFAGAFDRVAPPACRPVHLEQPGRDRRRR